MSQVKSITLYMYMYILYIIYFIYITLLYSKFYFFFFIIRKVVVKDISCFVVINYIKFVLASS